ncbi:MAG: hypothetical protein ACRCZF_24450, partial [Gemmataceae bacterium]
MKRWFLTAILATALGGGATAQQAPSTGWGNGGMINPWNGTTVGSFTPPVTGQLPNGTPVVNPWVRPMTPALQTVFAQQMAAQQSMVAWNPALAGFWNQAGSYPNLGIGFQQNLAYQQILRQQMLQQQLGGFGSGMGGMGMGGMGMGGMTM